MLRCMNVFNNQKKLRKNIYIFTSIHLFVGLFFSRITQKLPDGFERKLAEGCGFESGKNQFNSVQIQIFFPILGNGASFIHFH